MITPTGLNAPSMNTAPAPKNLWRVLGWSVISACGVAAIAAPAPINQLQRLPNGRSDFVALPEAGAHRDAATAALSASDPIQIVFPIAQAITTPSGGKVALAMSANFTVFAGKERDGGEIDGIGGAARFSSPRGIAVDNAGNFYVSDYTAHTIRKITAAGVVTTLAGSAVISNSGSSTGDADGIGSAARFYYPDGIAVDGSGNVYVADSGNSTVRKITPAGVVTTIAGTSAPRGSAAGAGVIRFENPEGIAVDRDGTIYVSDNATIRKISPGGVVTTFAGVDGQRGSADGTGPNARFNFPSGLALDTASYLYVADSDNCTIRRISPAGVVVTIAGSALKGGSVDGYGPEARFYIPSAVALDGAGNLYVADSRNETIRKIDLTTAKVTTLAGRPGKSGSFDGSGIDALFNFPSGLVVDSTGNLFVTDSNNSTIRRTGDPAAPQITTQPQNQSSVLGGTATFTTAAIGIPTASYQWQRQPAGTTGFTNLLNDTTYHGITSTALIVSGMTAAMSGDQFRCVMSNLVNPNATTSAATLSLFAAPVFTGSTGLTFKAGQLNTFTVTVTGTPTATLTSTALPSWLVFNASTGVLSGTPPDASGSPISIRVTASNGATVSQNFTITVVVPILAPIITAQPISLTVNRGSSAVLSVAASSTVPFSYQWRLNGAPIPGATDAAITIANVTAANGGDYTAVATNAVGSVTSAIATLVVVGGPGAPVIAAQPVSQVIAGDSTVVFTVTTSGIVQGSSRVGTADRSPRATSETTYQWQFNGGSIDGASSTQLVISKATTANAGVYTCVVTSAGVSAVSSPATLVVTATTNTGRLINLSVITDVTAAAPNFTVATVIGGSGTSGPKALVVRAAGPSLGAIGVPDTLADPTLDLFAGQTVAASNDNWNGDATLATAMASVGAFPYASAISKDAAVFKSALAARDYTMVVSGVGASTGTVIAEIYDATPGGTFAASTPRLINVSTLKQINVGGSLTLGFTVGGSTAKTVLIRAIGPGLAAVGVNSGTLVDPQLTLYNGNSVPIASDNDWGGDPQLTTAGSRVGAFVIANSASKDAMLLVTLPPGGYTAKASGVGGVGGLAIVEVYEVP